MSHTPSSRESVPTSNLAARIVSTLELAEGLSLVLVTGPDLRAPEGLALLRSYLPNCRPTLWYRLDLQGPDLVSELRRSQVGEPIVLVHGLEYLAASERAATEASMNLLRDRLALLRAAVLLWIPRSDLESFQRHCADLFSWRALLVSLSEEQVPVASGLEVRRAYLADLKWELERALSESTPLGKTQPVVLIEREVALKGGGAPTPLSQWAQEARQGLLHGEPKSGKSTALRALALQWVREALAGGAPGSPCPLLISARSLYVGPNLGLDIDDEQLPRTPRPAQLGAWARAGGLVILLDGFDEVNQTARARLYHWLEQLRREYPGIRIIVSGRPHGLSGFGAGWYSSRLMPLPVARLLEQLEQLAAQDPSQSWRQAALEEALRGLESLPGPPQPLPPGLGALFHDFAMSGRPVPPDPSDLLREVIHFLISTDVFLGGMGLLRSGSGRMNSRLVRGLQEIAISWSTEGLERTMPRDEIGCSWRHLDDEVMERYGVTLSERLTWLVTEAGGGGGRFVHTLFRQYWAARWVWRRYLRYPGSGGPQGAAGFMERYLDRPDWQGVVAFVTIMCRRAGRRKGHKRAWARRFLNHIWRLPGSPGPGEIRRLALVLASARAARLQPDPAWLERAEQLCLGAGGSEEEHQARAGLQEVLRQFRSRER